jgi:serine protease Do
MRGRIGVQVQELTADLANSFGLKDVSGALVGVVEKGGPADRAGILPGDVIVAVGGRPVQTSSDMARMVAGTRPGTTVPVQVWRHGETKTLAVTVAEQKPERPAVAALPDKGEPQASPAGLQLRELTTQQRASAGIGAGVLVAAASGAAVRAGILPGDLILALNNAPVQSVQAFEHALAHSEGKTVAVLIKRGDASLYVPLRLG